MRMESVKCRPSMTLASQRDGGMFAVSQSGARRCVHLIVTGVTCLMINREECM